VKNEKVNREMMASQVEEAQGCQIFLGTLYQSWKNVPNYYKITKYP
jgi:hypothetical protein